MEATKEWLEKYEEVKDLLVSPVNYDELFVQEKVDGKKLFLLDMGEVSFPTGSILVRDPLVYLRRDEEPYLQNVPRGTFPIDTLVVEMGENHYRYIATRVRYCDFEEQWKKENPDGNIYDDYFAEEFSESYIKNPKFQREAGDWINYTIPGTKLNIPMIQSGFGDGYYPVYFGYDKDGEVCSLIIEYIFVGEQ